MTTNTSTTNGLVACTPFPARHIEKKRVGGMVLISNNIELQELTVVLSATGDDCKNYLPGAKVWVRGDLYTQQWAKDVYTVGGKTFILVPKNFIQLVEVSSYVEVSGPTTLKVPSGVTLNPTAVFVGVDGNVSLSGDYTMAAGTK